MLTVVTEFNGVCDREVFRGPENGLYSTAVVLLLIMDNGIIALLNPNNIFDHAQTIYLSIDNISVFHIS